MSMEDISFKFKNKELNPIGTKNFYSVLIPLIYIDNKLNIIFEVRSKDLEVQPCEISFPGGRVELGETYKQAAIRETCEEVGICNNNIDIIGAMDYVVLPENFVLYPFIGMIKNIELNNIKINKREVDHIFTVPIDFFINNPPEKHFIKYVMNFGRNFPFDKIPNGEKYKWRDRKETIYFYQHGQYNIWGITAKIIYYFIKDLK